MLIPKEYGVVRKPVFVKGNEIVPLLLLLLYLFDDNLENADIAATEMRILISYSSLAYPYISTSNIGISHIQHKQALLWR